MVFDFLLVFEDSPFHPIFHDEKELYLRYLLLKIFLKTSNPNCGCVLIRLYSSSVREDAFKTSSGIPIFPISCNKQIK